MNKLYVFMGYPGSGKSTIAREFAAERNALYLASDEVREKLFGFRDQTRNTEVFDYIKKTAIEHSSEGDCVIDATNLNRKDRVRTLNDYKKYYELHLFCILRPIDEIFEVNNDRKENSIEQYIDENELKRIIGKFQLPTSDEGWSTISFKLVTNKKDIKDAKFNYAAMKDIPHDNPHHSETIKEHIDFVTKNCTKSGMFKWLGVLGAYHDVGKFYVIKYNEERGYSQCLGHAAVSAYIYLVDTLIDYLLYYGEQQKTDVNEDIQLHGRYIALFNFSNIVDILNLYYLIFYHDQPFTCEDREHLIQSLSKPNKSLAYWQKQGKIHIEMFADILLGFNKIDRMREDDK